MSAGDQRDEITWVVIELTRQGEIRAEEGSLIPSLRNSLGVDSTHPFFLPSLSYLRGGRRISIHLMEGYLFVGTGLAETAYMNLERTPFVKQVLTTETPTGMRALSTISDLNIEEMRSKLRDQISSDIESEMEVAVTQGRYAPLTGKVLEVENDDAHVRIQLRSIDLIVKIPRVFLAPTDEP